MPTPNLAACRFLPSSWVLPNSFVICIYLCCRTEETWVCRQLGNTSNGRNSTCLPEVLHNKGWTGVSSSHLGQFWQTQSHIVLLEHPEIKQMGVIAAEFLVNIKGKFRCKTCYFALSWVSGWDLSLWVACPQVWRWWFTLRNLFLVTQK